MRSKRNRVLLGITVILAIAALIMTGVLVNGSILRSGAVKTVAASERSGENEEAAESLGENASPDNTDEASSEDESANSEENEQEQSGTKDESTENGDTENENNEEEPAEEEPVKKLKGTLSLTKDSLKLGRTETWDIMTILKARRIEGNIKFKSSDKSIVTINKVGQMKAKSAGTATITVSAENAQPVTLSVIVYRKPTSLKLNVTEVELNRGGTKKIKTTLNEGAYGDITYTSSNPSVATVSKYGTITAVKKGNCTISAITFNGLVQEVSVKVRPDMKSWSLSDSEIRVPVGSSRELSVTYTPRSSYNKITYSSSDKSVATVSSSGKVKGVSKGNATITAYCEATGETQICEVEVYYAKQIAITFDDGPGYYSEELLDFLDQYNVKVTFFYIGNQVSRYASSVKRAKEAGHEIGCHSWSHPVMSTLSVDDIESEFSKTNKAIKSACGSLPTVFRPPYGSTNDKVNSRAGMPVILWNIDTHDWKYKDSERLYNYLLDNAADGQIILMHEIHGTTIKGFKKALPELIKRGFELVTVTELLSRYGEAPKAGVKYSQSKKLQ